MKTERNKTYIMMCLLIVVWGTDYIFAKSALTLLDPLSLLFFKYLAAVVFVAIVKLKIDKEPLFRKKDIPMYILCVMLGEIAYFYCEYTAMSYLPVSLISIIIAFVPAVSVIIERVLYKKKTSRKMILGIFACIFGIVLIIGVDIGMLLNGKMIGYLLAFACVFSWNAYNFITASLHDRYTTINLTINQISYALILLLPYVIHKIPMLPAPTPALFVQVVYLGVVSSGVGFLIQIKSLRVLGPTMTALFSNFLPVTTTFFGWLILKETISPIQMLGGVIVICAGYIVIKGKGEMDANDE